MAGRPKAVAIVSAAISCLLLLASCQPDTPTEAAPAKTIAPSPTPTEPTALEIFADLRERADAIYAKRDFKAIENVYDPSGPMGGRVVRELKILQRDNLVLERDDEILNVKVIKPAPTRIVLVEKLISDGGLFDERGRDVTKDRDPQRQVVRWILIKKDDRWLIHDAVIQSSRDA